MHACAVIRSRRPSARPDPESRWEAVGRGNGCCLETTPTPARRVGFPIGSAPAGSGNSDLSSVLPRGGGVGRPPLDEGFLRSETRGWNGHWDAKEGSGCTETHTTWTSVKFCAAAAAAEARGAGLQGSACPRVTRAQRGPKGTSESRRLRGAREPPGSQRRRHLSSASVPGANTGRSAAHVAGLWGGRAQGGGTAARRLSLRVRFAVRCWKIETPHRGGKEAPRSPGVLDQTKKRSLSSVRVPNLLSLGGAELSCRRWGGRAGSEFSALYFSGLGRNNFRFVSLS